MIDGLIKMSVSRAGGRYSTFTAVTAGGWAGEGSLRKPGPWRDEGVAARNSRLVCAPRHTFKRRLTTPLLVNHFLLSHLNARLSLFIGLVEYDRLLGPSARAARCLARPFLPGPVPARRQLRPAEPGGDRLAPRRVTTAHQRGAA